MPEHETHSDDHSHNGSPTPGTSRTAIMVACGIIWLAVTGYFIGLGAPMMDHQHIFVRDHANAELVSPEETSAGVIPATAYGKMRSNRLGVNRDWATRLATIKQEPYDLYATISLDESQKAAALTSLAELRAFNGAPPTVPHPIEQMTSRGCVACHREGLKTESLRAAKMPHPFFSSCTQCHVEKNGNIEQDGHRVAPYSFRENTFVGLTAPTHGSRSFAKAPPVIPHTTWLRDNCLSCHGRTARLGMQTTHPWRHNCVQCHGVSSPLNQAAMGSTPQFLPPPQLKASNE